MNRILSAIILAVASAFAAVDATAATRVTASIDSTVVEMGSRATISIEISDPAPDGILIDLPEAGTEIPDMNVDFISVEADTFPAGYEYRLLIQAFKPGTLTFPPFRFVAGNDTVASDFLTLKVLPVDLDSLSTINPMDSVANPPRRWYDYIPEWTLWLVLGLALATVAVCLFLLYRRTGSIVPRKVKAVDPYEAAMTELARLKESRLAESGRDKEYYTRLVDILRVYLERRFGINAMEMSSTQILDSLRNNPETRDDRPRIRQILEIADFVKFANVRPMPDDNIKTFNNVLGFVEDTRPKPVETDENKEK